MIAVDTNLLVYAHRGDSVWNIQACACLQRLIVQSTLWAIPWPCIYEFYSIVTHPKIYAPPSTPDQALSQLDAWFEAPNHVLLAEEPLHWEVLRELLSRGKITGPLMHDARIAALCIGHAVHELWTADRDFGRFTGLRTRNPLVETE